MHSVIKCSILHLLHISISLRWISLLCYSNNWRKLSSYFTSLFPLLVLAVACSPTEPLRWVVLYCLCLETRAKSSLSVVSLSTMHIVWDITPFRPGVSNTLLASYPFPVTSYLSSFRRGTPWISRQPIATRISLNFNICNILFWNNPKKLSCNLNSVTGWLECNLTQHLL